MRLIETGEDFVQVDDRTEYINLDLVISVYPDQDNENYTVLDFGYAWIVLKRPLEAALEYMSPAPAIKPYPYSKQPLRESVIPRELIDEAMIIALAIPSEQLA